MSDNCKGCSLRGDIALCEVEPCSGHDGWYIEQVKAQLAAVTQELEQAKVKLNEGSAYTDCPMCGSETARTNEVLINKKLFIAETELEQLKQSSVVMPEVFLSKMRKDLDEFCTDNCSHEPDTNAVVFSNCCAETHANTIGELIGDLEALANDKE